MVAVCRLCENLRSRSVICSRHARRGTHPKKILSACPSFINEYVVFVDRQDRGREGKQLIKVSTQAGRPDVLRNSFGEGRD